MLKPAKNKRFVKIIKNKETGRLNKISYGQAGKSSDGKDRIRPGTKKGDAYCARSLGIAKKHPSARNPNSPNFLSRKKWKCKGDKSIK